MSTKREWFAAFRYVAPADFEAMAVSLVFVAVRIRRQRDR